jgi:hypothetical protein
MRDRNGVHPVNCYEGARILITESILIEAIRNAFGSDKAVVVARVGELRSLDALFDVVE